MPAEPPGPTRAWWWLPAREVRKQGRSRTVRSFPPTAGKIHGAVKWRAKPRAISSLLGAGLGPPLRSDRRRVREVGARACSRTFAGSGCAPRMRRVPRWRTPVQGRGTSSAARRKCSRTGGLFLGAQRATRNNPRANISGRVRISRFHHFSRGFSLFQRKARSIRNPALWTPRARAAATSGSS